MPEHFLLQNTFKLPNEAILRSTQLPESSMYLTKTCAASGDDDDHDSPMNITSGWNNSFLTKTDAAPGDDDDYSEINLDWGPWESLFF